MNQSHSIPAHLTAPPDQKIMIFGKLYAYPQGDTLMQVPATLKNQLSAGTEIVAYVSPFTMLVATPLGQPPIVPQHQASPLHAMIG